MCKGLSIDDVGVPRDTVFQEVRSGAGFETGDFVNEKMGELPWNDSTYSQNIYILVICLVERSYPFRCGYISQTKTTRHILTLQKELGASLARATPSHRAAKISNDPRFRGLVRNNGTSHRDAKRQHQYFRKLLILR